jgi:ribonucleoside-diphosphate reductase alpha chain
LPPFGVCNLGHFVLPRFYDKDKHDINWSDLERAIRIAVRLQDNIIDYTSYFLEENKKVQLSERRVGIGTMGLGTLMIHMKLRYGSPEGLEFIDKLYKFIAKITYDASMDLAKEKGAFEQYDYEKFKQSGFMKRLLNEFPELDKKLKKTGIRNVTLLTQAPTGSTGTYIDNIPSFRQEFGGTTTGIEPYFNWSYWRASRLGFNEQTVDLVENYRKEHGLTKEDILPDYFVTAMELSPLEHVTVQGAIQKWVDSSISKTANAPSDFTVEQTDELYMEGYKLGLKGITIYRDKSRDAQVLSSDKDGARLEMHAEKKKDNKENEVTQPDKGEKSTDKQVIKKVPSRLFGMREKVRYQSGDTMSKAYIHIYVDESGVPMEVWIEPTDVRDKDMADALGRMTTQFLRFGGTQNNVEQAVKHLKAGKMMMSLPAIVGRLLNDIYYGKIEMPSFKQAPAVKKTFEMAECLDCGAKAYDKANCICNACGQSKCN